jgi:hypothetical protein
MLLMETIYTELHDFDIVENAEEFSTRWCGRSKCWFAVQKHKGGDLSVAATITLLNYTKIRRVVLMLSRKKMGAILDDNINLLTTIIKRLDDYLLQAHNIAEVAETAAMVKVAQQTQAQL